MPDQVYYRGPANSPEEAYRNLEDARVISVDTETVSLKDRTLIGIGIATAPNEAFYFPLLPKASNKLDLLVRVLLNPARLKVFHNATFDLGVMWDTDLPVDADNIADTSIMAQVSGRRSELRGLVLREFFHRIDAIEDILPARKTMLDLPTDVVAMKCLSDVQYTYKLYLHLPGLLSAAQWDCYQVDLKLLPLLLKMSRKGLKLRQDVLEEFNRDLSLETESYRSMADEIGFNPASFQQVGHILASRGNRLPIRNNKLVTDEEALESLDDPVAMLVLNFRSASKLLSSYVKPWIGQERGYGRFRLDLSTGRLACSDRNLQNIPKHMRRIFEPDSGMFTWFDYNQIELRVFAEVTHDPMMKQAYKENKDLHAVTSELLFPLAPKGDESWRDRAKAFNFQVIYMASDKTLSVKSGLSQQDCARHRQSWLGYYKVGHEWMVSQMNKESDYAETMFGRRMLLPDSAKFPLNHIQKCKINFPVQGTAADVIKRAMIRVAQYDTRVQNHDELVFDGDVEVPDDLRLIAKGFGLETPFKVRKGATWE